MTKTYMTEEEKQLAKENQQLKAILKECLNFIEANCETLKGINDSPLSGGMLTNSISLNETFVAAVRQIAL